MRLSKLALALTALTAAPTLAQPAGEPSAIEPAPSRRALVVLTGEASGHTALRDVIVELLVRQGVKPQVESQPRFSPAELLDQSAGDARSYAFVSVPTRDRAKLYFRGPYGQRFLLRELSLRDGLDELGRELIARVVETSLLALLDSSAGVSESQARAELERDPEPPHHAAQARVPAVSPSPTPGPNSAPEPAGLALILAPRLAAHFTGPELGGRFGLGLDAGLRSRAAPGLWLGARLALEAALPQRIDADEAKARIQSFSLRAGLELGAAFQLYAALLAGIDVVHLDPLTARAPELSPNQASTELSPSLRAELRYELPLSTSLELTISALCDLSLRATRYDVIQGGSRKTLASPWLVQPGLGVGLSFHP